MHSDDMPEKWKHFHLGSERSCVKRVSDESPIATHEAGSSCKLEDMKKETKKKVPKYKQDQSENTEWFPGKKNLIQFAEKRITDEKKERSEKYRQ